MELAAGSRPFPTTLMLMGDRVAHSWRSNVTVSAESPQCRKHRGSGNGSCLTWVAWVVGPDRMSWCVPAKQCSDLTECTQTNKLHCRRRWWHQEQFRYRLVFSLTLPEIAHWSRYHDCLLNLSCTIHEIALGLIEAGSPANLCFPDLISTFIMNINSLIPACIFAQIIQKSFSVPINPPLGQSPYLRILIPRFGPIMVTP